MTFPEIKSIIDRQFPGEILGEDMNCTPNALLVSADNIGHICHFLREDPRLYFDSLSCLTGLDNGPDAGTMEVIYNLYSIPFNHQLMIKVSISRSEPKITTVSNVWRTANWHEREAFDLLGIEFDGHPDLRRILLPRDWEGHPLRKDYAEQEKYHGITVKY